MFDLQDYEPADARIAKWWEKHPRGSIQTEIYHMTETSFIVKATGYTEDGLIVATGYAQEVVSSKGVNANFALENCETSSIARMLANAGFQAKLGKRPSREEMDKVNRVTTVDQGEWLAKDNEAELLAKAIGTIKEVIPSAEEAPTCSHGTRVRKTGISSKTGKPYAGWTCPSKNRSDQCEALWDK